MRAAKLIWTSLVFPSMISCTRKVAHIEEENQTKYEVDDVECCLCEAKVFKINVYLFIKSAYGLKQCGKNSVNGQKYHCRIKE